MSSARRAAATAVAFVLSLGGAAAAFATPAHAGTAPTARADATAHPISQSATTGYTYWGYYVWNTEKAAWDYMTVGANDAAKLPKDGDVYGFRWALVVQEPRLPRAEPDFEAICSETPQPEAGENRIAFVLDYGADVDAPNGESPPEPRGACALVSEDFTVQQALQTVAEVRTGPNGLICGVDAYPADGCGDTIKNAEDGPPDSTVQLALPSDDTEEPTDDTAPSSDGATDGSDSGGFGWGIALAGAVVVGLGFGAYTLMRRQG